MKLVRHPTERGLWVRGDEAPPRTGLHAVVVGVSDYPNLGGGSTQQTTALGGQLAVCASSAAQIFDWLRTSGSLCGRPVLSCRLLLAPGPNPAGPEGQTETEFVEALTKGWFVDPTFDGISRALRDISNALFRTPAERAGENAVFGYFAGHGLEVLASPSFLARDILEDSVEGPGNAIAYEPMMRALSTFGVGDGLFLFDCCRNAPEKAKENNIVGRSVLEPHPDRAVEAPRSMLYLKATKAAGRAYQDPASARRATIFGEAVIEALEGLAPSYAPYDQSTKPWKLLFENLQSFVTQRVREAHTLLGSVQPQNVVKGGEAEGDILVIVAERDPVEVKAAPPEELKIKTINPSTDAIAMSGLEATAKLVAARSDLLLETFGPEVPMSAQILPRRMNDLANRRLMSMPLKSNAVTSAWLKMIAINNARTGEEVDPAAIKLDSARLSNDRMLLWLDISVSPGMHAPLWLTLNRPDAVENPESASMGIVLPRDDGRDYAVRLEIGFQADSDGKTLLPATMTGRLAPPRPGAPETWTILWAAQRDALLLNSAESGRRLGDAFEAGLIKVVERKRTTPLAAAIAASALLQADRLEPLQDWPRNLMHWFPHFPDGPVLWAETLMRRRRRQLAPIAQKSSENPLEARLGPDGAEALEALLLLEERGPPLLAPVLAMAIGQVNFWMADQTLLDQATAKRIELLSERLLRIGDTAEPDTLFVSMRMSKDDISRLAPYQ